MFWKNLRYLASCICRFERQDELSEDIVAIKTSNITKTQDDINNPEYRAHLIRTGATLKQILDQDLKKNPILANNKLEFRYKESELRQLGLTDEEIARLLISRPTTSKIQQEIEEARYKHFPVNNIFNYKFTLSNLHESLSKENTKNTNFSSKIVNFKFK